MTPNDHDSSLPGDHPPATPGSSGPAQTSDLPDREVVAQIALDLTRLNADQSAPETLEAVQADIQNHGLTAFFHAAVQTLAAESARAVHTGQVQPAPTFVQTPGVQSPGAITPNADGVIMPGENSFSAATQPGVLPAIAFPLPGFPGVTGAQGRTRQTWFDCIRARSTQPMCIFFPTSLDDLREIMQQAEAHNCRVKAVGSGHSFADIASTRDFLVQTHGFRKVTGKPD
ncbi:MAG: FAD-binding protein, partial [Chloroflexi bacterium]